MIEKPSAVPTCTVITATWRFRDGAGEAGWELVKSGDSRSSGRQVGDSSKPPAQVWLAGRVSKGSEGAAHGGGASTLGHSTPAVTARHYAHFVRKTSRRS
jgi:hypothetical protein